MKIKLFENFDEIDLDITYELWITDSNGDEYEFNPSNSDFNNVNPFDFKDVANYYMKYKRKYKKQNFFIKKVTKETLDEKTIELLLNTTKYNL
jgi:hypothetical protein